MEQTTQSHTPVEFDEGPQVSEDSSVLSALAAYEEIQFQRDPDDETELANLFEKLAEYEFTDQNKLSEDIKAFYRSIEQGFSFSSIPTDRYFNPFQVETLLDQSSDLLDRANRDRREWDDLADKWTTLLLELFEYSELDKIHADEEQAGSYEIPYRVSASNFLYEHNNMTHQQQIWATINRHISNNLSNAKLNEVLNSTALTSWLSGLVPYTWNGQSFAGYTNHTFDGVSRTVADHAFEASYPISLNRALEQYYGNAIQRLGHSSQNILAGIRKDGFQYQANWDAANVSFQKRRTIVARRLQDIKVKLALGPDGLLNSGKRLPHLKSRFQNDFRNALARLRAAEEGLLKVFGINYALPDEATSGESFFDDCVVWVREAIQIVISFSQRDQSTVVPFSVKEIVGNSAWNAGISAEEWEVDFSTLFPAEVRHVRLRGVSATSEDAGRDQLWTVGVRPPDSAILRLNDGNEGNVDQSDASRRVVIGRVTGRNNPRAPDVSGVASLHNLSAIGTWNISLVRFGNGPDASALQDITLDLHLVFQQA